MAILTGGDRVKKIPGHLARVAALLYLAALPLLAQFWETAAQVDCVVEGVTSLIQEDFDIHVP
jgi:hypothetical protein